METDQIHVVAAPVPRDAQQLLDAREAGFTRQILGDVFDRNLRDRVDDNVPIVHPIAIADLHARTRPDANGASDSPAADAFAKMLGELHAQLVSVKGLPSA
jgi:hypothetical protein